MLSKFNSTTAKMERKSSARSVAKVIATVGEYPKSIRSNGVISVDYAYSTIIREQYNLNLMDTDRIEGKIKWSWELK